MKSRCRWRTIALVPLLLVTIFLSESSGWSTLSLQGPSDRRHNFVYNFDESESNPLADQADDFGGSIGSRHKREVTAPQPGAKPSDKIKVYPVSKLNLTGQDHGRMQLNF